MAETMMAVVTLGTGGLEQLSWQAVPKPVPEPGEALLRVLAAGVNNTEINTRLGWYSSSVTQGTGAAEETEGVEDGGWNAATPFPLIQGTDCCGEVVAGPPELIGRRALVRACQRPGGWDDPENIWMGSDFDGAFAEFVLVKSSEVFAVDCSWSDAELATIPCAYGTAENMLERAGVAPGDHVLVPGASGGVGSAAVQLARRRGARVTAITSPGKADAVAALGAARVLTREDDVVSALGAESVDVVVDNVAGAGFPAMLKVLKRRGRLVSSGAIAGPIVALDMRDMYLKDITLIGTTGWDACVFPNLIRYIEAGEIRPLVAARYPMPEIARAQTDFMEKTHLGNFVLIPPGVPS